MQPWLGGQESAPRSPSAVRGPPGLAGAALALLPGAHSVRLVLLPQVCRAPCWGCAPPPFLLASLADCTEGPTLPLGGGCPRTSGSCSHLGAGFWWPRPPLAALLSRPSRPLSGDKPSMQVWLAPVLLLQRGPCVPDKASGCICVQVGPGMAGPCPHPCAPFQVPPGLGPKGPWAAASLPVCPPPGLPGPCARWRALCPHPG